MNKTILVILDGWGYRKEKRGNAVLLGKTPNFDKLWKKNSHCLLGAAGKAVGLPAGLMGNSEVGHLNLGAGRVLEQELLKIDKSIKEGSFFRKKIFGGLGKRVHLIGMLSDAGVHSQISHLFALMKLVKKKEVFIHVITDGRDTEPKACRRYFKLLLKKIGKEKIATVSGRYFAMDRDRRWRRTKKAYEAMVLGKGRKINDWKEAVKKDYKGDEFIMPSVVGDYSGMRKGDSCVFFNFREDRARQLTRLIYPKVKKFICMCEYDKKFKLPCVFKKEKVKNCLAEVLNGKGLKQLHAAETEKYAHVTYFFNGGREKIFKWEDRKVIPSPKVAYYDKTPGMKAREITDYLLKNYWKYDFCVVNFCNGDMVGHTGNLKAAIKSVEVVDECLGRIMRGVENRFILITADHGTCEDMTGKWRTSHTLNKVPFVLVGGKMRLRKGNLGDVAPTVLKLMGIKKPKEMTGKELF